MKLSSVLILAACGPLAFAQQTIGQTDVYYDSGRNVVYAVGSTNADYNTQYDYTPWVYTSLWGDNTYAWDSEPSSTYVETPAEAGYEAIAESTHTLSVVYQVYEIEPSCTVDCYDWWDDYGYELLNNGGDPTSEGPSYTIWGWYPPIVITSAISQIVVDQESGGRFRPVGPWANFDVRLRSFIPPLYVKGPEPFCSPFLPKARSITEITGGTIRRGPLKATRGWCSYPAARARYCPTTSLESQSGLLQTLL